MLLFMCGDKLMRFIDIGGDMLFYDAMDLA
jgi:hypothetical protein